MYWACIHLQSDFETLYRLSWQRVLRFCTTVRELTVLSRSAVQRHLTRAQTALRTGYQSTMPELQEGPVQ
jgi:hypothetical protein